MTDLQTPQETLTHYAISDEAQRLFRGAGPLELARTQEILERPLPSPPAVVFDVGGSGVYACWLARKGYEVHLIDAVPLHVEQARRASEDQPDHPLASAAVGDARQLEQADASADAVRWLENNPTLLGASAHVLAVARKAT